MNDSKTGRWFLLVCLALAPSTAVLAEPPSDGPTQQRLIVRRAAASVWKAEPPGDCPFPRSGEFVGVRFTGRSRVYTTADTWYPSWADDGNLYSPFTDGAVGGVVSHSGPNHWLTGHARITGDNPLDLEVTVIGTHRASAKPYGGRYPCGSLMSDGVWYYGTYCLDRQQHPWDVMGPLVGFRVSTDHGQTWIDTPCTPEQPLFGESGKDGSKVKFGSPHFVDFGRNMEHSPDGRAYLVGHGATRPDAACSWISGDQVYMARVKPSLETINDLSSYEFFAGHDPRGEPIWSGDFDDVRPLLEWNDRMGCVTVTYNRALEKYIMCFTDGGSSGLGTYDTSILVADRLTGPWRMAAFLEKFGQQAYFVNVPSKFISPDGRTAWLCFADDWVRKHPSDPEATRYGMCLYEFTLLGPNDGAEVEPDSADESKRLTASSNIAPAARASASSTYPNYSPDGAIDRKVGGYPGDISEEWASHEESRGAWLRLEWDAEQTVDRVWLFDRPNSYDYITAGELRFSDGSTITVGHLPDDARAGREVRFSAKTIQWLEFHVTDVKTGYPNIGLAEIGVFTLAEDEP